MSIELEQAMVVVGRLAPEERAALARLILPDDPAVDARWDALFEGSRETLDALADELIADHAAGKTRRLDPDAL